MFATETAAETAISFAPTYLQGCGCPACMAAEASQSGTQRSNGTADAVTGLLIDHGALRWNAGQAFGTAVTIQYSFMDKVPAATTTHEGVNPADSFQPFSEAMRAVTREILQEISQAAGLKFVEVADGTPTALLQLGEHQMSGISGYAYYPTLTATGLASGQAGDVWLNSANQNLAAGGYLRSAIAHEIGHALGLDHPFSGTTAEQLPAQYDNTFYTVMSYNTVGADNQNMVFVPNVDAGGVLKSVSYEYVYREQLAVYDIQTLQFLYGASSAAAADNVYSFGNTPFRTTIADNAGTDTIDASAATLGSTIDLRPEAFSSIAVRSSEQWIDLLMAGVSSPQANDRAFLAGVLQEHAGDVYTGVNNLSIARGTVIENALGGAGDDVIIGNSADNRLTGNGGNDRIDGGAGFDTAVYSGSFSAFQLVRAADGSLQVTSTGAQAWQGSDTLTGIEALQFGDRLVFNLDAAEASVARLYSAAFGRAPDAAGLAVQLHALDAGTSLAQLADNFLHSGEYAARYGLAQSNAGYPTALYKNVLDRDPDSAGLAVQVEALDHGLSRVQLLLNFADSAENRAKVAGDWLLV
jgi:hypothetical protein